MSDDSTLSHEDALAALKTVRAEAASYRTKLRDAEKALEEAQATIAQYEQDSTERQAEAREQAIADATDLPVWAITAKCEVSELFAEDGTLDAEKLKGIEQQVISELPKQQQRVNTRSGAGKEHRPNGSGSGPTWGNLLTGE